MDELNLSWNHLRGKGAQYLAMGIAVSTNAFQFSLSIGNTRMYFFFFSQKNSNLRTLNISWNGFGFEGCAALGLALRENNTLEDLNIACNRIHPPALYELLKGVVGNKSLLKLKVSLYST